MNQIKLYDYQTKSVEHLLTVLANHGAALDASAMGTGKTYVACEIARRLNLPTLVVCPKISMPMWESVAKSFGTEVTTINYEMLQTGKTLFGYWEDRTFKGKKIHKHFVYAPEIKFLIFDEVHKCTGWGSHNSKMLASAESLGIPILMLSGTLADDIFKLSQVGNFLGLRKSEVSPWQWCVNHGCVRGPFGGLVMRGGEKKHREFLAKKYAEIFPNRGIRNRISDLPEFPESDIRPELFLLGESTGRINELYRLIAEQLTVLTEQRQQYKDARHPLTMLVAARQEIELLKMPIFAELAVDEMEAGNSVVIFVNFAQSIAWLRKHFKTNCIIDGQTVDAARDLNIANFQNDTARLILVNSAAGGMCISLHDLHGEYPRTALISPGYSATTFRQLLFRVHRAGSKTKSRQRIILARGTDEEGVYKILLNSLTRLDALMDGDLLPKPSMLL